MLILHSSYVLHSLIVVDGIGLVTELDSFTLQIEISQFFWALGDESINNMFGEGDSKILRSIYSCRFRDLQLFIKEEEKQVFET